MKGKRIACLVLSAVLLLAAGAAYAELVQGEVVSVDLEGKTLEVKPTGAAAGAAVENQHISVTDATTYSGEVTAFAEIIEGDTAKIEATKDASGKWVAGSVDISVAEEATT